MSTTRRAVVSYPVDATDAEKARACIDGIRECAIDALEHGARCDVLVKELEQVANDAEGGDLDA